VRLQESASLFEGDKELPAAERAKRLVSYQEAFREFRRIALTSESLDVGQIIDLTNLSRNLSRQLDSTQITTLRAAPEALAGLNAQIEESTRDLEVKLRFLPDLEALTGEKFAGDIARIGEAVQKQFERRNELLRQQAEARVAEQQLRQNFVRIRGNVSEPLDPVGFTETDFLGWLYSTMLNQTTDPALSTDNWHYIEVKVVVHDTAGSYEIRVDGVTVLSDTNVDTRGGDEDSEIVQFKPQVVNQELDDIYICDTDGTTNNDFLGQVVIEGIFPSADGDASGWTPASGTDNSAMVDDIPPDDDTSYVESNTQGDEDLYDYADLSTITTEPILGLQVNTDVRMNEFPGDFDLYQPVKSGSTTSDGQPANIATDNYEVATRILETDPDTSSAWTASGVNGTQFGIKVGT